MTANRPSSLFDRRSLLKGLGLAGASAVVLRALGARPANAAPAAATGGAASSLHGGGNGAVDITTGPLPGLVAAPGTRLGVGIVVAGAAGAGGDLQLVTGVSNVRLITPSGGEVTLEADQGVESGTHRLLQGLATARPAEAFGFSGTVPEGLSGEALVLSWTATLRGGRAADAEVRKYLTRYHGVVLGLLAKDSTFTDGLVYAQVRRLS
jgi:hypothetical protein